METGKVSLGAMEAVGKLEGKVAEIQGSVHNLLAKLELQDQISWPDMLESYSVLAAQVKALLGQLKTDPGATLEERLLFRTLCILPTRLSMDMDPDLQRLSEGRLSAFSHAEAPLYLRTKPDPPGQQRQEELTEKAMKISSVEQSAKQVGILNKQNAATENALESLLREEDGPYEQPPRSHAPDQTKTLVEAVLYGAGLRPDPRAAMGPGGPMPPHMAPQPHMMGPRPPYQQ